MARDYEDISSSKDRRWRVTPRETPTASSLIAALSVEELSLYSQVPSEINLEMSDGSTTSIEGETDNAVYFT